MIRAAIGFVALLCVLAGCDRSNSGAPTPDKPAVAGGNSRVKFKPEYKKMLDKDGKLPARPSQLKNRAPRGAS